MGKKALLLLAAAVAIGIGYRVSGGPEAGDDQRLLLGRLWIDHLPQRDTEPFELFVAITEEPFALFQRSSAYEGAWAVYRYEPRGDRRLVLLFPQDGSRHEVRYRARECDERGFDYCLELEGAPRGARRYVSKRGWEIEAADPGALRREIAARALR